MVSVSVAFIPLPPPPRETFKMVLRMIFFLESACQAAFLAWLKTIIYKVPRRTCATKNP